MIAEDCRRMNLAGRLFFDLRIDLLARFEVSSSLEEKGGYKEKEI
jgi:hypothetical protein